MNFIDGKKGARSATGPEKRIGQRRERREENLEKRREMKRKEAQ
jgi:hypothetical protein